MFSGINNGPLLSIDGILAKAQPFRQKIGHAVGLARNVLLFDPVACRCPPGGMEACLGLSGSNWVQVGRWFAASMGKNGGVKNEFDVVMEKRQKPSGRVFRVLGGRGDFPIVTPAAAALAVLLPVGDIRRHGIK